MPEQKNDTSKKTTDAIPTISDPEIPFSDSAQAVLYKHCLLCGSGGQALLSECPAETCQV